MEGRIIYTLCGNCGFRDQFSFPVSSFQSLVVPNFPTRSGFYLLVDPASIANSLALALYAVATVLLFVRLIKSLATQSSLPNLVIVAALIAHGIGAYGAIAADNGFRFGFFIIPTLIFWVINVLVLVSGLRKPLHNLFLFLLPLSLVAILSSMLADSDVSRIESGLAGHIILSLVAYSLLTIATLQAILLAYLNRQLKAKHATGLVRVLPPLQTMDVLMFELIWAGQIVLTLAIVTGAFFVEDLFAQRLSHHAVISVIAWVIYAILLWGHHQWGWRGKTAVRWALGGFTCLILAYFGTKFVYEVIRDETIAQTYNSDLTIKIA